jgi:hypothetical protein
VKYDVEINKSLTRKPSREGEVIVFIRVFVGLSDGRFVPQVLWAVTAGFLLGILLQIHFLAPCRGVLFALRFILVHYC